MQLSNPPRLVRVTFRKQVSDGNYGTEAAEVQLDWTVTDDELATADVEAALDMLAQAREVVHNELRRSPSAAVRRSVEMATPPVTSSRAPRTTAPPLPPEDDDGEKLPF